MVVVYCGTVIWASEESFCTTPDDTAFIVFWLDLHNAGVATFLFTGLGLGLRSTHLGHTCPFISHASGLMMLTALFFKAAPRQLSWTVGCVYMGYTVVSCIVASTAASSMFNGVVQDVFDEAYMSQHDGNSGSGSGSCNSCTGTGTGTGGFLAEAFPADFVFSFDACFPMSQLDDESPEGSLDTIPNNTGLALSFPDQSDELRLDPVSVSSSSDHIDPPKKHCRYENSKSNCHSCPRSPLSERTVELPHKQAHHQVTVPSEDIDFIPLKVKNELGSFEDPSLSMDSVALMNSNGIYCHGKP